MQYGNEKMRRAKVMEVDGLNRTMQYGNTDTTYANIWMNEFKSYYVVWKHRYDLCEYLDE